MTVPSWDQYFLSIAKEVSTRSKDAQTKHGCVLVDVNNHIVGTGYNSFPPNLPDSELPNTRPDKYRWILHSEQNALLHRIGNPTTAYITGRPCLHCLMSMYTVGVRRIVASAEYGWSKSDEEEANFNRMLVMGGIEYCTLLQVDDVDPTLDELCKDFDGNTFKDVPSEYFDGGVATRQEHQLRYGQ